MIRRHLLTPGLVTRKRRDTHSSECPSSQAPHAMNRSSSLSMKDSCAGVAFRKETPWLKDRGRRPPLNGILTPWRIMSNTLPLAPIDSHARQLLRTR